MNLPDIFIILVGIILASIILGGYYLFITLSDKIDVIERWIMIVERKSTIWKKEIKKKRKDKKVEIN